MKYMYHAQYQANEYANSILPVPSDYPLNQALPNDFRSDFIQLVELAKKMYRDMAENPEAYGVMLLDINVCVDRVYSGPILESHRSIQRLGDVLFILFDIGEESDNELIVDVEALKLALKTNRKDCSTSKVSKYDGIFERLIALGFEIFGYQNGKFSKGIERIRISYPKNPKIVKTLKIYCNCRLNSQYKDSDKSFYLFDYKFTADISAMSDLTLIEENIHNNDNYFKKIYLEIYKCLSKYKNIKFDGEDFYYGKKRIGYFRYEDHWRRDVSYITDPEYWNIIVKDKNVVPMLNIQITKRDNYTELFNTLPTHTIEFMKKCNCRDCDAFKHLKVNKDCPFHLRWSYDGIDYVSCNFECFNIKYPKVEDILIYVDILASEYKLKLK